jgi:sterol desaturase/sphingolipid hydroxylase (fatty acid hydroxylase superfamily)
MHTLLVILGQLAVVTLPALRNLALLAVGFSVLAKFSRACNFGPPWWRKPGLSSDICFALVPCLINVYAQTALLVAGIAVVHGISGEAEVGDFLARGHGLLERLPFWQQVILYLIGNDLLMYLTHRTFHNRHLWRFHMAHHSSTSLEWISANRSHPIDQTFHGGLSNVVMILLGTPPDVLVWLMPWAVCSAALVHANLDWDFGRFRYLIASPVFHRWHHTSPDLGGNSNFAGTFPLIDLLFGTFYMPRGARPSGYGVDETDYPQDFLAQLAHPFRRYRTTARALPRLAADEQPIGKPVA